MYEEYMKIFLNREVEKKQIAGDHRELILSIHGLLAWVLQVQAETGQGSGSITMEAMQSEVAAYLNIEEHDPTLAKSLLKGTVERVGALVSRVQGTFEFEVQPLREFFAARHLHKTAPYSPPGSEKQGTRPDRFAALAVSLYWTNVTRFFCGFYDVGELPSLVDGLIEVGEGDGYRLITQPRRLALMLLSDYVFTQSPRSMRRLINFLTKEPDFERLIGADLGQGQRGMNLPETAGGKMLFEVCVKKLQEESDPKMRRELRQVMARNVDHTTLKEFWLANKNESDANTNIFNEAREFGLVEEFTPEEIAEIADGNVQLQIRWLVEANLIDHIVNDANLYEHARSNLLDFTFTLPVHRMFHDSPSNPLVVLSELINPHVLSGYFRNPSEHIVRFVRRDFFQQNFLKSDADDFDEKRLEPFDKFVRSVVDLMDISPEKWRADLEPWEKLVDRGFQEVPGERLFSLIAMISTAVSSVWTKLEDERESKNKVDVQKCLAEDSVQGSWDNRGFAPTAGLVRRLFFAKSRGGDLNWWQKRLKESAGEEKTILLAALVCWGKGEVLSSLSKELSDALDVLNKDEWSWFWNLVSLTMPVAELQMEELVDNWFSENMDNLTERLVVVLMTRLRNSSNRREVARKCFSRYRGQDRHILQKAIEWELLSKPYDDIDWEFAMRLSAQAKESGVEYLFPHSHVSLRVEVPKDVAKQVLEECGKHNWQFVSLCERSFGSFVAQNAKRVSTVAVEQNWFDSQAGY